MAGRAVGFAWNSSAEATTAGCVMYFEECMNDHFYFNSVKDVQRGRKCCGCVECRYEKNGHLGKESGIRRSRLPSFRFQECALLSSVMIVAKSAIIDERQRTCCWTDHWGKRSLIAYRRCEAVASPNARFWTGQRSKTVPSHLLANFQGFVAYRPPPATHPRLSGMQVSCFRAHSNEVVRYLRSGFICRLARVVIQLHCLGS